MTIGINLELTSNNFFIAFILHGENRNEFVMLKAEFPETLAIMNISLSLQLPLSWSAPNEWPIVIIEITQINFYFFLESGERRLLLTQLMCHDLI